MSNHCPELTLPAYRQGLSAHAVDAALRQALDVLQRADRCAVLWFAEIEHRGLYRALGYSSIHQYATEALGFSRSRTYRFLRLANDLKRLPKLRKALASGKIPWTKAYEVAKVASAKTEETWIQAATRTGRRELQARVHHTIKRAVRQRKEDPQQTSLTEPVKTGPKADAPVSVVLRLTPLQLKRYETQVEHLQKKGMVTPDASREEILLAALDALIASEEAPECSRRHNYTILVNRCSACGRMTVETQAGTKTLTPPQAKAIECDAVIEDEEGHRRSTIPPSVRRIVLQRDRYRCRALGCNHTRHLEVHHRIPRARGGSNDIDNLVTLCSACHRRIHEPGHRIVLE